MRGCAIQDHLSASHQSLSSVHCALKSAECRVFSLRVMIDSILIRMTRGKMIEGYEGLEFLWCW